MIKKTAVILAFVLAVLSLTSCNSERTVAICPDFGCLFSATYNDMEIGGDISAAGGTLNVKIMSPDTLNGLEYSGNADEITVNYLGLTKTFTKSALPESAFVFAANKAILDVIENRNTANKSGDGYLLDGIIGNTKYSVLIDSDLKITEVQIPEYELVIKFFDYK